MSSAASAEGRTLLLGMGNPLLTDDGVGVRLAAAIAARLPARADLTVVECCCTGGLNLLDVVEGYDRLIVLDSIKTRGGRPGTWYRFDGRSLRETMNLTNVHDANFATAMELGRCVGVRLPADEAIHVFAVEVKENLTFGDALSPEVEAAMPGLVAQMLTEVATVLRTPPAAAVPGSGGHEAGGAT